MTRTEIRLALPSKGRMQDESVRFLDACGLDLYKPNPRQYHASIPAIPQLDVIFQRPGDIVVGVRQGSLDFGIVGLDLVAEKRGKGDNVIVVHDGLGFGHCYLGLAVPESWNDVTSMTDLARKSRLLDNGEKGLRVATKFPLLTSDFLARHRIHPVTLIEAEGTLEVAPTIGYADIIADLVSTGTTLRDNRLRPLPDGVIIRSQGALIANRQALQTRSDVLAAARELLEFFEAHIRARENYLVVANVRGADPERIAKRMFAQPMLGGLQGPTIAPIYNPKSRKQKWHSVSIVVRQDQLTESIAELREIGGSGVVVSPVTYIFEEEPARYTQLLRAIRGDEAPGLNSRSD